MDIKLEQKKYRIPKRYRTLVIGGEAEGDGEEVRGVAEDL